MISRRAFLAGLSAAAAAPSLLVPSRPALASSGCTIGAIRWDPWYGSGNEAQEEAQLGADRWKFRAPWFSRSVSSTQIVINGNKQANIDLELQAAHAAGLQYFAYDWYPASDGTPLLTGSNAGMMNAWQLHQSSSYASLMKWCILFQNPGSDAALLGYVNQFATYMTQSNYLTVLSGRPVFMWFTSTSIDSSYAPGITALRAAAVAAGLPNPYVVVLQGQNHGGGAVTVAQAIGADAISGYAAFLGYPTPTPFSTLTSYMVAQWAAYASAASAASLTYVPNGMLGDDRRPRLEFPPTYELTSPYKNDLNYTTAATITDRVTQVQDLVNFINANASVCSSKLGLLYSWDECSEGGGCLIPTIGDPPASTAPYMNGVESALSSANGGPLP